MFYGYHHHTLDEKGRLSLPSEYRAELKAFGEEPSMLTLWHDRLLLCPPPAWAELLRQISAGRALDPGHRALKTFTFANSAKAPVDRHGRISIPANLREAAGLRREVTVVGVDDTIEIWDRARFLEFVARTQARHDELTRMHGS